MSDKMEKKKIYKTADITLAASLIEKGMKVIGVEAIPEKKRHEIFRFLFDWAAEIDELVRQYMSKQFLVEPTAFMINVRHLKQMIKDGKAKEEEDESQGS